ncbi:hypothetical protein CO115_01275 [Candidatus Falkowbacteria bacterium CG_4_9_14_3_um_filter_36_9]|uniref:HTH cro/C1-type domain-containing protein n=1 Tax=Candidatus Falkowbacteria bacterium CG02_land_8_20_14_3_00_36_14 TaxID=1974560 RepID=A0A2M7DQW5_9BACT|nr:MAG: hypothetical protein COS18_00165 [Candidatus Falkowbacteria bacterium CG02_land_8_20_14_3_00_36_14]PIX10933.1 MAG: hypothetical protein COZ73_03970 [Candidatus Falkowbacteria bacterium CG_4_8_14_3_um_filter_36_11]PJA10996.1 MAG: hypothetical protein COX67_02085 [Candidatus Falkowbacteria bacterium CG_4_10_14_0_2_um_filter_36_22]PJB20462.1 MAG: hypothetical protein CO115_01275 [Candidatus Falkowbacteria bacterium CG_4_9_14_3_um_filter_36_9]
MTPFKANKIFFDSETVAEQLRCGRQAKKLKLKEAADRLNINYKYLEAMERGNFNELPAGIYKKNFLREYAIFLGLDYKNLLRIFNKELVDEPNIKKSLFSRQIAQTRYFLKIPSIIKSVIIILVVIACFIYLGGAVIKIITPPKLSIISPDDNIIINNKIINVIGITDAETQIIINDEIVLSDNQGNFSKIINLKEGINIIKVTAKKKYGRESTAERKILIRDK